MANRTVFLTGGTGFLGGHVARALCAAGWRVRALARDPVRARNGSRLLEGVPIEIVAGDLSSTERLGPALEGVDAIVHVAGLLKARSLQEYREVNVRGTSRLVAAATRFSPRATWVQISSLAAAGPAVDGRPVAEGDASRPVSWYGRSKREGELAVSDSWRGPWIVLRPSVVYGPGDRGLLVYFRMALTGWIPLPAAGTRIQMIGAERAAAAIASAAGRADLAGRTGFLSDPQPIRLYELASQIAALPSRRARVVRVPDAAVRILGLGETVLEALLKRSRPFNADKAREILAGDWLCDGAPIARDLALPAARPLGEELRAAWNWYRQAGWLAGVDL